MHCRILQATWTLHSHNVAQQRYERHCVVQFHLVYSPSFQWQYLLSQNKDFLSTSSPLTNNDPAAQAVSMSRTRFSEVPSLDDITSTRGIYKSRSPFCSDAGFSRLASENDKEKWRSTPMLWNAMWLFRILRRHVHSIALYDIIDIQNIHMYVCLRWLHHFEYIL